MLTDQRPLTDAEIAAVRADLQALRVKVRQQLAADLGGEPADYRAAPGEDNA